MFDIPITYSVPTAGWFNYEDTSGNFLLVPPGNDRAADLVLLSAVATGLRFRT